MIITIMRSLRTIPFISPFPIFFLFLLIWYCDPILSFKSPETTVNSLNEEITFNLVDGDSSSGRLVASTKSYNKLRIYKQTFKAIDCDYACRQMGFSTGYMNRRYFGFTSYHKRLKFLSEQVCTVNDTSVVCYATKVAEAKHQPPPSEDVTVRCLKGYDVVFEDCKNRKGSVQYMFCEVLGRECGIKNSQVFTLLNDDANYVIVINCTGILAGTTTMYACSTTGICKAKLNLLCAEPCQFSTTAESGRIFFDEMMIDREIKIPRVCKLTVKLAKSSYVVISISRLRLRHCQDLYVVGNGQCFGELYLSRDFQLDKRHFRLFECTKFQIVFESNCITFGAGYFDIEYSAEFYTPVKPISQAYDIGANDFLDFSFSCGFYYQNLTDYYLYMSLINLTRPYKRSTLWSLKGLDGKEIAIKNFTTRAPDEGQPPVDNYTFGLNYFKRLVTRNQPLKNYAGTYNCRQNIMHGDLTTLDWNAELILFTQKGECVLEEMALPGVKIVVASCRIPFYGRFAPVATFHTQRLNLTATLILNGTTRYTAEYHLMILFDSNDPLEATILQEWHINSMREDLSEVHCKLFFVEPDHNPPARVKWLPCNWPKRNASVAQVTREESKFIVMVVIMAVSLILPFVNFLTMCLWSVVQKKTLKRAERIRARKMIRPRFTREIVSNLLEESRGSIRLE